MAIPCHIYNLVQMTLYDLIIIKVEQKKYKQIEFFGTAAHGIILFYLLIQQMELLGIDIDFT